MRSNNVEVLTNRLLADDTYLMTIPFPYKAMAGQFVMLKPEYATTLLARPISICNIENDELHLLYKIMGKCTDQLSKLAKGDIITVTGPVGHGFPVDTAEGRVALVGGGVGVAPLLYTAKKLREKGISVDCYLGFKDKTYLVQEFSDNCDNLFIYTESGSSGKKGYAVADLNPKNYSSIYCCGPTPMMKVVTELCHRDETPVYVSLETKMACGIGACKVCTCTTKESKNLRTCMDGPVFLGEEINFDA